MADETEGGAVANKVEVEATLVHGEVYYLGNKVFHHGKPVPVTDEEREMLEDEEHAADVLTVGREGDSHVRLKFSFAPVGSGQDAVKSRSEAEAPSPPRRVRAAGSR
jgi:hypothetical protein